MEKMEQHLVLDLETLGTKTNSSILTIGALIFNPNSTDILDFVSEKTENSPSISTFYKKISLDSCESIGLEIDDATIKWWSQQNQEAQDEAFSDNDRFDIKEALLELNKFSKTCKKFWAKDPGFDCSILEYVAEKLSMGVPWQYYQTRSIRTIEDHIDFKSAKVNSHNALEDSLYEAASVQAFYKKLRNL